MTTCIILGSGASVGFGLPTFGTWMDRLSESGKDERDLALVCRLAFPKMDLEAIYQVLSFNSKLGIDPPLMRAVNLMDTRWTYRIPTEPYPRVKSLEVLAGLVDSVPKVLYGADAHDCPGVEAFVERLRAYRASYRGPAPFYSLVQFVSLNWDTRFENEMAKHHFYRNTMFLASPTGTTFVNFDKPHGSLDVFYCRNCEPEGADAGTSTIRRIEDSGHYGTSVPDAAPCETCGSELVRTVVPPNLEKLEGGPTRWYAENWKAMYRKIQRATELITVGYSLPATDHQVGLVVRTALAHNRALERAFFVTGSNRSDFRERINSLLATTNRGSRIQDAGDVHFIAGGFEGLLAHDPLPACLAM